MKTEKAELRNSVQGTELILGLLPRPVADEARQLVVGVNRAANGVLRARQGLEAARRVDALIEANPSCTPLLLLRGFLKRTGNEFEASIQDFTEGLRFHPEQPQGWFWRSTALGALGRFAEAVVDLDRAISMAPACAEYYKMRGQAREKLGLFQEAIDDFGATLEHDPGFHWAHIGRAVCLARLGRKKEALADLDKAIALCAEEEWAFLKRSLLRRELGDVEGAVEDVNRACALNPSCDWVIGKPPFEEKRLREAVAQLDGLLARAPGSAWALAWRGQTKLKLGLAEAAEADLSGALDGDLGRGRGWVLAWRGEARRARGRLDEAGRDLDEAVAARPDYPRAYYWRGLLSVDRGRPEDALKDLRRSAELDDRSPEVHALLGAVLAGLGRLEEAESSLTRGLRVDPSGGEMLKGRARVRAARGDVDGQVEDLCSFYGRVQVTPEGWRQAWSELEKEAGTAAQRVWSRLPLPAEVYAAQAKEACDGGRPEAALRLLDGALDRPEARSSWLLHHWRGLALRQAGRLPEALEALNAALKLKGGTGARPSSAPPRPEGAVVDARVELLGVLQLLLEPRPEPEFVSSQAPEMARYCERARGLVAGLEKHEAVALARGLLQEPKAFRWFKLAELMLGVSPPPELKPLTAFAGEFRHAAFLDALRDLARRCGLGDFVQAARPDCERWVSAMRQAVGGEDFTATVSGYLGAEVRADYGFIVSPLARGVSYSGEVRLPDGWVQSRTILCPRDSEASLREVLEAPSREALWVKGWHEVCHVPMDPWAEAHAAAIARAETLYSSIVGVARRTGWLDCLSEHLVVSPSCRLAAQRCGAAAGKKARTRYKQAGYIYMDRFVEALDRYEAGRSRWKTLADFYPEWLGVLEKLG